MYAVANEIGYIVLEINASDERKKDELEKILRIARSKTHHKIIILFDEVDGLGRTGWKYLRQILKESLHPVIITANNAWKVPDSIKKLCEEIRFFRPSKRDILKLAKRIAEREGIEVKDYSKISNDIRNSLLAVFNDSQTYQSLSDFDIIKNIFERGDSIDEVRRDSRLFIWLIDNVPNFYDNVRDMFKAIQIITLAQMTKRVEILRLLPKGKRGMPEYPYFFRRAKKEV